MLIFGEDTWALLDAMVKKLEVVHVGFLRQVMRMNMKRKKDGSWWKV